MGSPCRAVRTHRETRTTRPAAPTAATAPRTTTPTTTDPTTTPTTTVRRTTSRRPNRRLRRCTPLLLRSEPTMMILHGIDPRAALSNVDVCHTHIEIVVCVLAPGCLRGTVVVRVRVDCV